jgi:hypothetical protein
MEYYREYIEIADPGDGGPPYTAEVKLCHDFPIAEVTGGNRVVVLDGRVTLSDAWSEQDMPTETWGVIAV